MSTRCGHIMLMSSPEIFSNDLIWTSKQVIYQNEEVESRKSKQLNVRKIT